MTVITRWMNYDKADSVNKAIAAYKKKYGGDVIASFGGMSTHKGKTVIKVDFLIENMIR